MPEIKLKHVVSCSSEDKVHKAENLLKCETYRKWKCAVPGEKQVSVILQFEKALEIYSIDIGNEASAFIEVSVGRSSNMSSDYQVLLVASSFMSPLESRNETKTNRVRMFGPDRLSQNLKNEKWDCVKIVCTQPFNKNIQYGLSFVKFHSPPELPLQSLNEINTKESITKFGAFKLKMEEEVEDNLTVGSWFFKRNESPNLALSTGPAAIRQASSYATATLSGSDKSQINISPKPIAQFTKQKHEINCTPIDKRKESVIHHVSKDKMPDNVKGEKQPFKKNTLDAKEAAANKVPETKKEPFNQIMRKVVFVLSGFQNPLRSELRDKALEMGAKYKVDWDDSSTHLICAFLNTPKYTQVFAKKGRIVTKDWICDSYKKRCFLPWRKYMLGQYVKELTTDDESVEEISQQQIEEINISTSLALKDEDPKRDAMEIEITNSLGTFNRSLEKNGIKTSVYSHDSDEDYQASTDIDSSSGGDTEDEIRKVMEQNSTADLPKKNKGIGLFNSQKENSLFDCDEQDGEEKIFSQKEFVKPETCGIPLPILPNFFKGKHFFLYGTFSSKEQHFLRRFILAFNGCVEEYMNERVKYVITQEKWDKNFDEALYENDNLTFVRPLWIYKCSEEGHLLPYQPYIVVPDVAS